MVKTASANVPQKTVISGTIDSETITSETQLRKIIKAYPKMLDKRILSDLDTHCLEFIRCSKLAVLALAGEEVGFHLIHASRDLKVGSPNELLLQNLKDYQNNAKPDKRYASLYFLAPGLGHALRVNGYLDAAENDRSSDASLSKRFYVTQAYVHCARAAARSQLWSPMERIPPFDENRIKAADSLSEYLSYASYALLKTHNQKWQTEVSPRGDQTGFLTLIEENVIFLPERPGNKVAVSLRNILQNPSVELLCMIPGCELVLLLSGRAQITSDADLCAKAAVDGKLPKLGILIKVTSYTLVQASVLKDMSLWDQADYVSKGEVTPFPKVLSEHMNGRGLLGKATNQVVKAVVNHDMKHLY
ncbi:hypothetical protein ACFOEK_11495 [Litoribrevibacter euphylliae]|uniref:Uncharacterized protein n=1 Tax=Litoribrevibacter euphylliae TaxID=1834034 RepID=A0ABV7HG01_9GAMM